MLLLNLSLFSHIKLFFLSSCSALFLLVLAPHLFFVSFSSSLPLMFLLSSGTSLGLIIRYVCCWLVFWYKYFVFCLFYGNLFSFFSLGLPFQWSPSRRPFGSAKQWPFLLRRRASRGVGDIPFKAFPKPWGWFCVILLVFIIYAIFFVLL